MIKTTQSEKFQEIFAYIRDNGMLVNKAQSAWGADRWECDSLFATLEDDGNTRTVGAMNQTCVISEDYHNNYTARRGELSDLDLLYLTVVGLKGDYKEMQTELTKKQLESLDAMQNEIAVLRRVVQDTFWMARRYANGRSTYAPTTVNIALEALAGIGQIISADMTLLEDGNTSPEILDT
jgi:hypothetical protein